MNWLRRLFSAPDRLTAEKIRWVVLDCESSGLDPSADKLLSIGAIAVAAGRIALDAGFAVVLRQMAPSAASNIAIHGLSGEDQRSGIEHSDALRQFAAFAGEAPLVAFHAAFDRQLLTRAARAAGLRLRNPWLDVAELAPVLHPKPAAHCRALDDWLDHFGIANPARHDALGDAYATAQLFQVLLSSARGQGLHTVRDILGIAGARRWLVP